MPEFEIDLKQRTAQSSPLRPQPITLDSPDIELPALDIEIQHERDSTYGRGSAGIGFGSDRTRTAMRQMAITADLFGTRVSARTLGVLLDISFSTHKKIDQVFREIDKTFRNALVVLSPDCVISTHTTTIYPLKEYAKGTRRHRKVGKYSTQPFAEGLLAKNQEFAKIWDKLQAEERGYIAFAESSTGRTANGGANDAMEFLRDQGVDTIYWFADFEDKVDAAAALELLKSMKRGAITLIMHDFVTPLGPAKKHPERLQLLQQLADETQGSFFLETL